MPAKTKKTNHAQPDFKGFMEELEALAKNISTGISKRFSDGEVNFLSLRKDFFGFRQLVKAGKQKFYQEKSLNEIDDYVSKFNREISLMFSNQADDEFDRKNFDRAKILYRHALEYSKLFLQRNTDSNNHLHQAEQVQHVGNLYYNLGLCHKYDKKNPDSEEALAHLNEALKSYEKVKEILEDSDQFQSKRFKLKSSEIDKEIQVTQTEIAEIKKTLSSLTEQNTATTPLLSSESNEIIPDTVNLAQNGPEMRRDENQASTYNQILLDINPAPVEALEAVKTQKISNVFLDENDDQGDSSAKTIEVIRLDHSENEKDLLEEEVPEIDELMLDDERHSDEDAEENFELRKTIILDQIENIQASINTSIANAKSTANWTEKFSLRKVDSLSEMKENIDEILTEINVLSSEIKDPKTKLTFKNFEIGIKAKARIAYSTIADFQLEQKQYSDAEETYRLSYTLQKAIVNNYRFALKGHSYINDQRILADIMFNQAVCYKEQSEFEMALEKFEGALNSYQVVLKEAKNLQKLLNQEENISGYQSDIELTQTEINEQKELLRKEKEEIKKGESRKDQDFRP